MRMRFANAPLIIATPTALARALDERSFMAVVNASACDDMEDHMGDLLVLDTDGKSAVVAQAARIPTRMDGSPLAFISLAQSLWSQGSVIIEAGRIAEAIASADGLPARASPRI